MFIEMQEEQQHIIDSKVDELSKYLKIDTNESGWHDGLVKELKSTNISYKIAKVIGLVFIIGSAIMAFVSFFIEGELILGLKINEHFLMAFFAINLISLIFILIGKFELKKERIKTFLLLRDLNK